MSEELIPKEIYDIPQAIRATVQNTRAAAEQVATEEYSWDGVATTVLETYEAVQ